MAAGSKNRSDRLPLSQHTHAYSRLRPGSSGPAQRLVSVSGRSGLIITDFDISINYPAHFSRGHTKFYLETIPLAHYSYIQFRSKF